MVIWIIVPSRPWIACVLLRIIVHHTSRPPGFIICTIYIVRLYALACTKDMSFVFVSCFISSDLSFALNGDSAFSSASRLIWHLIRYIWLFRLFFTRTKSCRNTFHPISAHRSLLTATIDVLFHLGLALNSNTAITTHQCRVAMCFFTCTGTKHTTHNFGGSIADTNGHLRIPFHSAYFATSIDVTIHRAATYDDSRSIILISF